MDEEWKRIPDFEDYEVSNFGRVRSYKYNRIRILKPYPNKKKYLCISLNKTKIQFTARVHTLVMLLFVGPRPEGLEINHKDGNKQNNRLDNLEYVTPSYNSKHSFVVGLQSNIGVKNPSSKLTEGQVIEIRKRSKNGETQWGIANDYGVHQATVWRIIHKTHWSHI